MLLVAIPF